MNFKDNSHEFVEYSYDDNDNMVKDLNKGISKIEYNFLNLPRQISLSGTNNPVNEYVYSAGGKKLSVIHRSSTEQRTDCVGNLIYENGSRNEQSGQKNGKGKYILMVKIPLMQVLLFTEQMGLRTFDI